MTPLFFLAATALLPYGYDAFVVLPTASLARARGGNFSKNMANAPTAESIQERENARAALLESGGVDELMKMLTELRDGSEGEEDSSAPAAASASAAVATPPPPAKVGRWALNSPTGLTAPPRWLDCERKAHAMGRELDH